MEALINDLAIDHNIIAECEKYNACAAGLRYLKSAQKTFGQLRKFDVTWFYWFVSRTHAFNLLEILASDPDNYTRYLVARNRFTPRVAMDALTNDDSSMVRSRALYTVSMIEHGFITTEEFIDA